MCLIKVKKKIIEILRWTLIFEFKLSPKKPQLL